MCHMDPATGVPCAQPSLGCGWQARSRHHLSSRPLHPNSIWTVWGCLLQGEWTKPDYETGDGNHYNGDNGHGGGELAFRACELREWAPMRVGRGAAHSSWLVRLSWQLTQWPS